MKEMVESPRSTRAIGAIALLQVIVYGWLAYVLPTWRDEEYTLRTTSRGIGYAFERAITFELQAPLYFSILALWRRIGSDVVFARTFSVLCAILATIVIARIAARYFPWPWPAVTALLIASNPFVIFAATEIRLYAFSLLLSAMSWWLFDNGFLQRDDIKFQISFVVVALAELYTQYYLGFSFVGYLVALLIARRSAVRGYLVACLVIVLGFVPFVGSVLGQMSGVEPPMLSRFAEFKNAFDPFLNFLMPHGWFDVTSGLRVHIAYYACVIIGAAAIAWGRPRLSLMTWAIVAIAGTIEALFIVLNAGAGITIIIPRQSVALFVPLFIAAIAVVADVPVQRRRIVVAIVVALYAVNTAAALAVRYADLTKIGDARRVAAYVSAHAGPHDAVAIFDDESVMPFERYYHGPLPIIPIPRPVSMVKFDYGNFYVHSEAEVAAVLDPNRLHADHVWLVTDDTCSSPEYGCSYIESYIGRRFRVLSDQKFYGADVRELQSR